MAGLVALSTIVAGCGDDLPSKTEFTAEIGRITGGRINAAVASCVYDTLAEKEAALLRKAVSTPKLSASEDDRMTQVLARCVIDEEERKTITTEDDRDADTDSDSDSESGSSS